MNSAEKKENKEHNYHLDPMSGEQMAIYEHINDGYNVMVDACAGSGKSTTILSTADKMKITQFVQLTYNSILASEIKEKKNKLELENLNVYTFHSLVVKYYTADGHTDMGIRRAILENMQPRRPIPIFNVLVIDEAQDMTFLYFKLIIKFCRDMGEPIQLLILGDFMQGLYEFKGADIRFLTFADKIWGIFEKLKTPVFKQCKLKVSYRITHPMADFVNNAMLGERRLYACKDGEPVVYLRRSQHDAEKYVVHTIKTLIENGESPSDIFVLGGSVKGVNSSIRKMENALVKSNIPCHVPMFETDKIDDRVIEGKVVFSTFHCVKGRQRKYVFVIGFDNSYFTYYARNLPPDICPNTLYVACTRATTRLFVLEMDRWMGDRPLHFLKMDHHEMKQSSYIDFKGLPKTVFHKKNGEPEVVSNEHYITPTDLIKFQSESVLEEILPILDSIFIKISEENQIIIDTPNVVKTKKGFCEDVSDLNGIAIPMIYFEKIKEYPDRFHPPSMSDKIDNGGHTLHEIIQNDMSLYEKNEHSWLSNIIDNELPKTCHSISDYLRTTNAYVAVKEKLYFKINQIDIDDYNWLTDSMISSCFSRIHETLGVECIHDGTFLSKIEETIIHREDTIKNKKINQFLSNHFNNEKFTFTARVDLITDYCVWELKCTNSLTHDHLLQVVIYAWLWRMCMEDIEKMDNIRDFKIFNIKTGDVMRLEATTEQLDTIMIALIKGKYHLRTVKKDDDFIYDCISYITGDSYTS